MKIFRIQYNIGKVKYAVSYHDGVKKHGDGSEFWDLKTFRNKKKLASFVKELEAQGYREAGGAVTPCTCSQDDGIHEWTCAIEVAKRSRR